MSSSDSDRDEAESTRPISVAELLARNGTIGSPPVGGRRRRRRGRDTVSVAELTGEIPVIRDDTPPPGQDAAVETEAEAVEAEQIEPEPDVEQDLEQADEQSESVGVPQSAETVVIYQSAAPETVVETAAVVVEAAESAEPAAFAEKASSTAPPRSSDPLPRRGRGPERGYYPRPLRRTPRADAEQMAYDPVDHSVDLSDLVGDQEQKLRSYLSASDGTLFSGDTVADDMARRGLGGADASEAPESAGPRGETAPQSRVTALRHAAVAVGQSVIAVLAGAGLFLGFDQLWRWNTIVALVLSVLVILGLVVAVRVVRRTEDIASTLIAVAVGALVTLGPLALLQSYG